MKTFNLNKVSFGFYMTVLSALLAVVSAVIYGVIFSNIQYKEPVFDITICIILPVAAVIAIGLLLSGKKLAGLSPTIMCLSSGISFLMFIRMVIWPISDTIYGIEPFPEFSQLITCAVLFILCFVVSEVALYMKKYK